MVATLNQVLGREREALDRERRLTDDLAHELRTPLAAIRTQLQVAQRTEGPRAEHARDAAQQAAERLGHSLDQLLALARERSAPADRASLDTVLDGVLEELAGALRESNLSVRRQALAGVPAAPAGLVRIVLRNSLPGVLSTAIFTFLLSWNDYLVAIVFLKSDTSFTLPIGLQSFFQQTSTDWGAVMAVSVITMLPPVILFAVLNRFFSVGGIGGSLAGN